MLRLTSHLLLEALFLLASVTSAFLPTTLLSPFKILVLVLLQGIDLHAYKTEVRGENPKLSFVLYALSWPLIFSFLINLNSNRSRVEVSLDNKSKIPHPYGFPCGTAVKNPPAHSGDMGLIPGSGRSPGVGNGKFLLAWEIPRTEGAWRATVHGGRKSQLKTFKNMCINYTFLGVHYCHKSVK